MNKRFAIQKIILNVSYRCSPSRVLILMTWRRLKLMDSIKSIFQKWNVKKKNLKLCLRVYTLRNHFFAGVTSKNLAVRYCLLINWLLMKKQVQHSIKKLGSINCNLKEKNSDWLTTKERPSRNIGNLLRKLIGNYSEVS